MYIFSIELSWVILSPHLYTYGLFWFTQWGFSKDCGGKFWSHREAFHWNSHFYNPTLFSNPLPPFVFLSNKKFFREPTLSFNSLWNRYAPPCDIARRRPGGRVIVASLIGLLPPPLRKGYYAPIERVIVASPVYAEVWNDICIQCHEHQFHIVFKYRLNPFTSYIWKWRPFW